MGKSGRQCFTLNKKFTNNMFTNFMRTKTRQKKHNENVAALLRTSTMQHYPVKGMSLYNINKVITILPNGILDRDMNQRERLSVLENCEHFSVHRYVDLECNDYLKNLIWNNNVVVYGKGNHDFKYFTSIIKMPVYAVLIEGLVKIISEKHECAICINDVNEIGDKNLTIHHRLPANVYYEIGNKLSQLFKNIIKVAQSTRALHIMDIISNINMDAEEQTHWVDMLDPEVFTHYMMLKRTCDSSSNSNSSSSNLTHGELIYRPQLLEKDAALVLNFNIRLPSVNIMTEDIDKLDILYRTNAFKYWAIT
jgi:hypothetical protein